MNLRRDRPRRRGRAVRTALCTLGVLLALLALVRVVRAPDPADARSTRVALAQLAHLRPGLDARANAMQALFPEGRVFTLVLYGLAWVDVGRGTEDAALRARALAEARQALVLAETDHSRRGYGPAGGLPHGVFYEGWTAHLRAGTLHLGGGAARDTAFRAACDRLDAAFRGAAGRFWTPIPGWRGPRTTRPAPRRSPRAAPCSTRATGGRRARGCRPRSARRIRPRGCCPTTPACRTRAASPWR